MKRASKRQVLVPLALDRGTTTAAGNEIVAVFRGESMGTNWSVKVAASPDACLAGLRGTIEAALSEVIRQMSPWEEDSCLSSFNRAPAGTWHVLPTAFYTVLEHALSVARASNGAFDPAVGRIVRCCGFGPPAPGGEKPYRKEPAESAAPCTWEAIGLDHARRRAFQPGDIELDLCAIAKGYAVDHLAGVIEAHGILSYLVEIGGELRGAGVKPDGMPWWVALEAPPLDKPNIETVVALCGLSVATSGGYRRYSKIGTRCRTHLIDPRAGIPLADVTSAVTVLAPLCMHADAWATALAVLGPEDGLQIAARDGIAALFTFGDDRQLMSPAMAAMLN